METISEIWLGVIIGVVVTTGFLWYRRNNKWFWRIGFFQHAVGLLLIGWFTLFSLSPVEVESTDYYEVKMVTFPDGKKVQMFTVDKENKNANAMFFQVVGDDMCVKRTIYKKVYYGVRCESNSQSVTTKYDLVKKELHGF